MTNENQNPADAFNNPFTSGLIKADAIDKIMANPELKAALLKIKL